MEFAKEREEAKDKELRLVEEMSKKHCARSDKLDRQLQQATAQRTRLEEVCFVNYGRLCVFSLGTGWS